jgi:hypothetical protein
MPRILALTLLACALLAAPAPAATVKLSSVFVPDDDESYDREDDSYSYSTLRYQAGPGERNRLVIRRARGGGVLFRDTGARIRPGRGCRAAGPRTAICRLGHDLRSIRARLGSGNDRLTVARKLPYLVVGEGGRGADRLTAGRGAARFAGGAGNDRLTGSGRSDQLNGDAGADRIDGRGGDDSIGGGSGADRASGGDGDDVLSAADGQALAADDRLNGGDGSDVATYRIRTTPVNATPAGGGMAGEADVFTDIEGVIGGRGDDVLTGDDGRNEFTGGDGHDRVDARGGDDLIIATPPADGDSLDITCGDGADVVYEQGADVRILARPDCERLRLTYSGPEVDPRPSPLSGRVFRLFLLCATKFDSEQRRVLVARTPGAARRWYENGPLDVEAAKGVRPVGDSITASCPVDFELTDAALELLNARGELPLEVPTNAYGSIAVLVRKG